MEVVVVAAILALIIIAVLAVFGQRGKFEIKLPFGIGANIDASNDAKAAVTLKGAKSHEGKILADDGTGRGVALEDVEAKGDITARSKSASSEESTDPKA